ncbi:MAG: RND transporter [Ruminococcus sp.]|nr:RND transporter [Ruminococcus sp.]
MNENIINTNENSAEIHRRKREIIKTILIIFLVALLILTFFQNTIVNKSLPEIATETCKSGSLTERFRGSGIIEANQFYEVTIDGNKTIDVINIKSGKKVEKGDVLFVLNAEESPELEEAENILSSLELDYRKSLLTVPNSYANENLQIKNAKADLQALISRKQSAVLQAQAIKNAKEKLNTVNSSLNAASSELSEYQTYIIALDTNSFEELSHEYSGEFIALNNNLTKQEEILANKKNTLDELIKMNASESEILDAESAYNEALTNQTEALDALDAKKNTVRDIFVNKIRELETNISSYNAEISSLENQISSYTEASPEEIEMLITEKERELESLIVNLDEAKKSDDINKQIEQLNLNSKKEAVDKQREVVNKIKEKSGTVEIVSKYSGVVSNVFVKVGETTLPDTPLATIDISSEGYTLKISASPDKTKKIKVGTEAEIVNNWSGDVSAVVTEIKNDNISKDKIITFNVTGNVESGDSLSVSIPCGTSKYDTIVPKNAVYEDSNGKFVMILNFKNTPLGNRYYAERVAVEVLASDDISSAVSGLLNSGDYIIANSSKPIKPGDQVRIKD